MHVWGLFVKFIIVKSGHEILYLWPRFLVLNLCMPTDIVVFTNRNCKKSSCQLVIKNPIMHREFNFDRIQPVASTTDMPELLTFRRCLDLTISFTNRVYFTIH
jgi:hypothetical protein